MKRGIIFAATGDAGSIHISMAQKAAIHVKEVMPDIEVHLFTNQPVEHPAIDKVIHLSDFHEAMPKLAAMNRTEFDQTIYLDSDVVVLADISELFETLESFDLAIAGSERPIPIVDNDDHAQTMICEKNTGVVAFRKSDAVSALFEQWYTFYDEDPEWNDQPALARAMYHCPEIKWIHLARIYNCLVLTTMGRKMLALRPVRNNEPMIRVLHLCGIKKLKNSPKRELLDTSCGFSFEKFFEEDKRQWFRERMIREGWNDRLAPFENPVSRFDWLKKLFS
ncbi:MAG: putative nucleotide-diphospho-sugar transferase [Pseudomonadota bacterium]